MEDIFDFEIIPVKKPMEIWNTELLSQDRWDNLFYRGSFSPSDGQNIRCITQCRNCYMSWFNIAFVDFEGNHLGDLVQSGFLDHDTIRANQMAEIDGAPPYCYYKTKLECWANYISVRCNKCAARHFLVLGITETQPGLYGGQLQGMWRLKE